MSLDIDIYEDDNITLTWLQSAGVNRIFYRLKKYGNVLELTDPIPEENLEQLKIMFDMMDFKDEEM